MTLTFKNVRLITPNDWKVYRHVFTKKFLRDSIIKKIIIGGLYCFDYTISNRSYNIHLHLLAITQKPKTPIKPTKRLLKKFSVKTKKAIRRRIESLNNGYIPQDLLSSIWKEKTGDSFIVDIRKVNNTDKAMFEVLKYVQSNKLLLEQDEYLRSVLVQNLKGLRLFSRFGKMYRRQLIDNPNDGCYYCEWPFPHRETFNWRHVFD